MIDCVIDVLGGCHNQKLKQVYPNGATTPNKEGNPEMPSDKPPSTAT